MGKMISRTIDSTEVKGKLVFENETTDVAFMFDGHVTRKSAQKLALKEMSKITDNENAFIQIDSVIYHSGKYEMEMSEFIKHAILVEAKTNENN